MLLTLAKRIMRRPPDFVIGGDKNPYMRRWFVIPRNNWFNVYLHHIVRSDDDRALHDHPYANCSILLSGYYIEIMPAERRTFKYGDNTRVAMRSAGSVVCRSARAMHRLIIGQAPLDPTISLFITGPRVREWGFYGPRGWVPWQQFTDPRDPGLYRPSEAA